MDEQAFDTLSRRASRALDRRGLLHHALLGGLLAAAPGALGLLVGVADAAKGGNKKGKGGKKGGKGSKGGRKGAKKGGKGGKHCELSAQACKGHGCCDDLRHWLEQCRSVNRLLYGVEGICQDLYDWTPCLQLDLARQCSQLGRMPCEIAIGECLDNLNAEGFAHASTICTEAHNHWANALKACKGCSPLGERCGDPLECCGERVACPTDTWTCCLTPGAECTLTPEDCCGERACTPRPGTDQKYCCGRVGDACEVDEDCCATDPDFPGDPLLCHDDELGGGKVCTPGEFF